MMKLLEGNQIAIKAREHLAFLAESLGPKPPGSKAYHAAAEYITDHFRDNQYEIELQEWECPNWEERSSKLLVNNETLPVAANAFSLPCDVSAPTIMVKTMAELELADIHGKIAILCGELAMQPLSPKKWFLASKRELRMIELLEKKAPAAIITVQSNLGSLERLTEDNDLLIPSAVVPYQAGLQLQNAKGIVHLHIDTVSAVGSGKNIIARNFEKNAQRIVLCAHYDTKHDTPGAADNAGGVAILLCLAEILSRNLDDVNLEFVAFGSEEYLPIGDDFYIEKGEDGMFEKMIAAINFDGAGRRLGANSIVMFQQSPKFQQCVEKIVSNYPGMVWVDPWPQSNHSTFAWRGVPSVAFTSQGGPFLHHLQADTIEWVDEKQLAEVVQVTSEMISMLQKRSTSWSRKTE